MAATLPQIRLWDDNPSTLDLLGFDAVVEPIVAAVREHVWPLVEDGAVRPIVQGTHPLERAADAHRELEASGHIGKILLTT